MKLGTNLGFSSGSGGLYSPDWAWLKQLANSMHPNLAARFRLNLATRGSYRHDLEASIKNKAGLPASETAGIPAGVTVGATGALTSQRNKTFTDEADVSALASSGTGTLLDPYIIDNWHFDAAIGSTTTALYFNDPDATYYVKVRNCKFSNYTSNFIILRHGTRVELENITFDSALAISNGIRIDHMGVSISNMHVVGLNITSLVNVLATSDVDIAIRYLKLDNSVRDWTGTGRMIYFNNYAGSTINFDVQYVDADFSTTTLKPEGLFYGGDVAVNSLIYNNVKWRGGVASLNQTASGGVPMALWSNIEMLNCDVADTSEEAVYLIHADNIEIGYGTFAHTTTGANFRVIYFDVDVNNANNACSNIEAHHLKITKGSGTQVAGNEVLESKAASGTVHFHDCWITQATEDAVEFLHLRQNSTFIAENIVGDNVAGQIMDVSGTWDDGTWAETTSDPVVNTPCYINHIYGDCGNRAVIIAGVRGVIIHDVYADNSTSATASVDIRSWPGTNPVYTSSNVHIVGAMPLAANQGTGGASNIAATGADIEFRYVDEGGTLQTDP